MTFDAVKLGRVARTISGTGFAPAFQGNSAGEVPFIKVSDLALHANRAGVEAANNWVSRSDLKVLGGRVAPAGSIVFPKVGAALLGNVRARLLRPSAMDNNLMAVVPTGGDSRFWFYALSSIDLGEFSPGGPLPYVTDSQVRDLQIPMPPRDEQHRIADFLDTETARIEGLIALRARQRDVLREELFARLEDRLTVPYARNRVPLMRLTDPQRPIQYGIVLPGPDWPGGVPIIKGGDIGARRLSPELLNRTDPEIESRYVRSRVRGGDYVVAIRGSVGEIAPVPDSLNGANLTQDSARIAPYECDAGWLGAVLQTPDLQNQMKRQTTGATIKGINISELRRLRVPAPSRETQERLGRWASAHSARADAADQALHLSVSLMTERRQALITAAVTGQLDVTTARGIDTH